MTNGGVGRGGDVLQQAMFALNARRPVEAEQIAREVLKTSARHPRALQVLGYALVMQGRAQDAIAALEPVARSGHDPEVETQLAIALRQAGQLEDAESRLKRAIKRRPPFVGAFHELGGLLASLERYDEAIEVFSRGLEVAPTAPEFSVQLGRVYLKRGDIAEAKTAFAKALGLAPNSHEALFGMARAHQQAGESAAAAELFRRCVAARSNDAASWLNLGRCLLKLGQRGEGYDCFRKATRIDPKGYGNALGSLARSPHGRFWLKPSAATQFFRETNG